MGADLVAALVLAALVLLGILLFRRAMLRQPLPAEAAPAAKLAVQSGGSPVLLTYLDSSGERSERTVTPQKVDGRRYSDGSITVEAFDGWCHLRRAVRTFRVERIISMADPRTGEIIANPAIWLALAAGLRPHVVQRRAEAAKPAPRPKPQPKPKPNRPRTERAAPAAETTWVDPDAPRPRRRKKSTDYDIDFDVDPTPGSDHHGH